jgi:DNA helicase HerA-like ATPase
MAEELIQAYELKDKPSIEFGGIILDEALLPNAKVNLSLKQFNRHGLVAGSTGSGKTKSLQVLAEQLSLQGVPCLLMDIKGDMSGLAMPGQMDTRIEERCKSLRMDFSPSSFPVELLSLSPEVAGLSLRSSIKSLGPLLFSRILELNDVQTGVVTILFEYAKSKSWEIIELNDFQALLRYCQTDAGNQDISAAFGQVSSATLGTIMRRTVELESQSGDYFFGEPEFDILDLLRAHSDGRGIISILRLMDMQTKPFLFSTVILKLISELYTILPEVGDLDKPKLVVFIDEAHILFKNASKPLLNMLDSIVKLIRSKGVGLIFCTQTPKDIPDNILSQLGFKIQHVLRAFTAKDRQAISLSAKNFPESKFYDTESLLTSLAIGQSLVTAIDDKGAPSPLVLCLVRPPQSRMGVLTKEEELALVNQSLLYLKYKDKKVHPCPLPDLSIIPPQSSDQDFKESKKQTNWVEVLSKNTLVRQILRDLFKKMTNVILTMLKK